MKKNKNIKINRGAIEEEKIKNENALVKQRAVLFLLPVIMIAVLVIGAFFGYKSYTTKHSNVLSATKGEVMTQDEKDDIQSQLLKIINSANPEDVDFVPSLSDVNGIKVSNLMVTDLNNLLSDAEKAGLSLKLKSGFVSFEDQKILYNDAVKKYKESSKASVVKSESYVKKTIPKEGECEQQTGLIVEFDTDKDEDFEKTDEYRWLVKNGINYGFILRYPNEENTGGLKFSPNLFRYVGKDHALMMRSYNMNFDEYVAYLSMQ